MTGFDVTTQLLTAAALTLPLIAVTETGAVFGRDGFLVTVPIGGDR